MVSLLDIADQQKTVTIRGKDVAVFGISAQDIVYLFRKFPELRLLMSGKQADLTPETLLELAPGAVAAAIAAGTGSAGDEQAEAVAARLGLGEQLDLLAAIFELTFPQGVGPFVAKLDALGLLKSAEGASGWAQDTKSPAPSKN
ncbi:MAG TPA: hypothetical protein VFA57_12395 [Pseudolabrys sp.]|nr:hypothetical protein [Pseudolabrys sp.]